MASGLLLAFLAGLVTILNPCVLPLVPILIGSALGTSRAGPLALGERRKTLAALARYGKPLFGAALVMVGTLVLSGLDKVLEAALLDVLPASLVRFTTRF
jgi:cytochrome c biogenesis protein CcdA